MGSRRGKEGLLLAVFWVVAIALIGTAANRLILHGPLGGTLQKKETGRMLMELSVLFLWNLWWLCLAVKSREKRGLAIACLIPGWLLFLWGHRILIPLIGAGVWMGTLAGYGICINNCFLENIGRKNKVVFPVWEKILLGLTTGSAAWMVLVCAVSLTEHGGIGLWRKLALLLALGIAAISLWKNKKNFGRSVDNCLKTEQIADMSGMKKQNVVSKCSNLFRAVMPETVLQAALLAFILTMFFLQAGRLNHELDYDSLHYGLRSAYVLDNGNGIYKNLGLINLVYTYSKGAEVLVLPLSGTPTYGFVLSFTFWTTIVSVVTAAVMGARFSGKTVGFWTGALVSAIPGIMNMAVSAKSDSITLMCQLIIYDFLCLAVVRENIWLIFAVAVYLLSLVYKPTALVYSTALGGVGLVSLLIFKKTG